MIVDLQKLLMEYSGATLDSICETVVSECELSFLQIRDRLYLLGSILYEDLEKQVYVANVRSGFGNMSSAVVVIQLHESKLLIVGYAKEGIIKQNICENAVQKVKNMAEGKKVSVSPNNSRSWLFLSSVITLALFVIIRGCVFDNSSSKMIGDGISQLETGVEVSAAKENITAETEDPAFLAEVQLTIEATKNYNEAVMQFNQHVAEYNEAVVLTCIDNISGLPAALEELATESESFEENAEIVRSNNSKETIATDTATILDMTKQVEQAITVVKQITVPSEVWVKERLKLVDEIIEMQAVTENLDPDDLLGKEGGFTACVYFAVAGIDQESVPGNSIVAKGTDAGGAIEVYTTLEDAEARCEYLSGFDGTILYSGSYAIIGTMVVRTSYKLTDEQQINLTDRITRAFTLVSQEN